MISFVLKNARRIPGTSAHAAPPAQPATTIAADVPKAHAERGGGREAGEGERRRRDQRVAERALGDEGGVEEPPVARERVMAGGEQHEAGGEEGEHERSRRDGD